MPITPQLLLPDTFEDGLSELDIITQRLEEGNLSLEDQLRTYERGMFLLKFCETHLNEAEKQVKVLSAGDTLVDLETLMNESTSS